MTVPDQLTLSQSDAASVLGRLASLGHPEARVVYYRIASLWLGPQKTHVTYRPTDEERAVLGRITLPRSVVQSHRYVALYRCDRKPSVEVTIRSNVVPPRRRKLKTAGGEARFTLIEVTDLTTKEKHTMARKTTSTKAKAKKDTEEIDELEAELEGLEELEEIEVEDEAPEEPDTDEEDDDEEDEDGPDLDSMTAAQLKAFAKENGIKGTDKKNKAALVALITEALAESDEEDEEEPEDEEPEDEEEDEPEEEEEDDDAVNLDELSRSELKALIKEEELEVRVTKGMSDDDVRSAIREALGGDDAEDDEEEDDEPVKPTKKATSKDKPKGKAKGTGPTPPNRELPKGKLGANDVAEAAGVDARAVRMFLRSERGKAFPKDEELNRYAFTSKQVAAIVKAMASKPARPVAGAAKAAQERKAAGAAKAKGSSAKGTGKRKIK